MTEQELNDRVAEWYGAKTGDPSFLVPLHRHLGMSWDEYLVWSTTGKIPKGAGND